MKDWFSVSISAQNPQYVRICETGLTFTCSKSTLEILEKCPKYVQS